jgi:uncharacterized protein with HEPN domain
MKTFRPTLERGSLSSAASRSSPRPRGACPTILEKRPDIPWEDIRGIGNILRHGYDKVDDRIIWTVIERHLAPLEATLRELSEGA